MTLPLVPLRDIIVFPHMVIPLFVGREKSIRALEEAAKYQNKIILSSQKKATIENPTPEDIYNIGTVAEIVQLGKLPDGSLKVLVEGKNRVKIEEFLTSDSHFMVHASSLEIKKDSSLRIQAFARSVAREFEKYVGLNRQLPPETVMTITSVAEPAQLADIISSHLVLGVEEKQKLLEASSVEEKLEQILIALKKENQILEIENEILTKAQSHMEKAQREFFLREKLKVIKEELGGPSEDTTEEVEEYRQKIKAAKLQPVIEEKLLKEVNRLEKYPPMAAETTVVRNYLDWILSLPWGKPEDEDIDLSKIEEIFNEDHYGLQKPKDRILEYMAVKKLTGANPGTILCLIGAPGVGKSSLARSVARALNRKFVRISLGGVRDEAEIRGHRRTYIGSMPGRMIYAMQQAGTVNPVILLDEIDKMSSDFRGNPAAALLEVLDPEQNSAFRDHYLEIDYDLSSVIFIATANSSGAIPPTLRDRLEVIFLPSYTEEEKIKIAEKFLFPKQLKKHGLNADDIKISHNMIKQIIGFYTREAGVRNLEREIAKICRKAARQVVSKTKELPIKVTNKSLSFYLGVSVFDVKKREKKDIIGVATGLAYTEVGGETLSIEALVYPGKGKLVLTGKLGDVMQESAQAAYSYLKSRASEFNLLEDFQQKNDVHLHVPEGAVPKDGPSAGLAMTVALISAFTRYPVKSDIAMTGEITLTGRVLKIGGLKEKVLAAYRAGIYKVILPEQNLNELKELPADVGKKMEFIGVNNLSDCLDTILVKEGS
ncbi:MAG: endopeptidase La [Actinobacteria bacterium]|nr:endopeptidase La [Actinomycetota bacterium]